MVAFDTNYLVRHLVQDDSKQSKVVAKIVEEEISQGRAILILDLVLCETIWVLKSAYTANRNDIVSVHDGLLQEPCFEFEDQKIIKSAVLRFKKGKADFSDYILAEKCISKNRSLLTFDKALQREL